MQLSRGLDPHNSSQNSDSKLNANRICETQYNFHSSRTKLKVLRKNETGKDFFFIVFNLSKRGCAFPNEIHVKKERRVFDHKNNNLKNQIT